MGLTDLVKKRTLFKAKLNRIQTTANKHDACNPMEDHTINSLLEDLALIKTKVDAIQEEAATLCSTDDEIEEQVEVSEWFQQKILHIQSLLINLRGSTVNPNGIGSGPHVRLPRMELPSFDGRHEDWQSFQDLFIATVDNNQSLSGAQKLQYLKSCVRGNAASLIQSFTITDQNYREAWGLLVDRYDNKRELVQAILKRLHNQPSVKTESPSGLQKLLDVTQECIRSLQVLGRPVDTWDDLLVFLVVEKLDSNSRREWAMTLKGSEPPSFKDLHCFLDLHIRGLQASGDHLGSHSNAKYKSNGNQMGGDKRHAQSHLGVSGGSCQVCKSAHLLHQCSKFQHMTICERVAVVNSSSLCINCLRPGHWANKCKTRGVCKFCKKKHNSLLHGDSEHKENHASSSSKGSGSEGAVRSVVSSHCSLNQVLLKGVSFELWYCEVV